MRDTVVSAAAAIPDTASAEEPYSKLDESTVQAVTPLEAPDDPESKVLGQMDTLKANREDVIAAYKSFLGRLPESMEAVDTKVGVAPSAILIDFIISKEFLYHGVKLQFI